MSESRLWRRHEIVLAIALYCRTRFGRIHSRNPDIIALAREIGRTPDAVALKMVNFAHLDLTLDRQGMRNVSKLDREMWNEFFTDPTAFFAEIDLQVREYPMPEANPTELYAFSEGSDYEYTAKGRKNQDHFRDMILATYENKCCVTGIAAPELLIASHIVPWAENARLRLDPRNGLCLNALHDKAFDRGLISFDDDYRLIVGKRLKGFGYPIFNSHDGERISLPNRFRPSREFLAEHRRANAERLA